jgi:hypothetical protein
VVFDAPIAARQHEHRRGVSTLTRLVAAGSVAAAVALFGIVVPTHARSADPVPATTTTTTVGVDHLRWVELAGPDERGRALGQLIAHELRIAGVPAPVVEVADTGALLGQFDARGWLLQLSRAALTDVESRTSAELARLTGAARHEARHAEQWFRMAQLRAAQGRSAAEIATEMTLPAEVAAAAAASPLAAGQIAEQSATWWDSVYGAGNEHRNRVLAEVAAAKSSFDEAARVYREQPSGAAAAAMAEAARVLEPVYARYRALPEEADAFEVQDHFVATLLAAGGRAA